MLGAAQTTDGSYHDRLARGHGFEDRVRHTLWLSGFKAYLFGSDLLSPAAKDVLVLVVCPGDNGEGLRAEWFDRLHVVKRFTRPPRNNFNGSGKGFVVIARSGMRRLSEVLEEFKNEK